MENRETFEDLNVIRAYTAAYPPIETEVLTRARERVALALVTVPRSMATAPRLGSDSLLTGESAHGTGIRRRIRARGRRLLIALGLAAVVGVPAAAYAGSALWEEIMPDRHGTTIQQFRQQHPYKSFTFVEQPVSAGMISKEEAIAAAVPQTVGATTGDHLNPNIQVVPRFGLYSSTMFLSRPVWVVTFSGPGVTIYSHGPTSAVAHEETVIVDGKTGDYLEARVGNGP